LVRLINEAGEEEVLSMNAETNKLVVMVQTIKSFSAGAVSSADCAVNCLALQRTPNLALPRLMYVLKNRV